MLHKNLILQIFVINLKTKMLSHLAFQNISRSIKHGYTNVFNPSKIIYRSNNINFGLNFRLFSEQNIENIDKVRMKANFRLKMMKYPLFLFIIYENYLLYS